MAVLLRGDDDLFDSSYETVLTGSGLGRGIDGRSPSANSSSVTLLSPSESSLLTIAISSDSVATNPLSLRKEAIFL